MQHLRVNKKNLLICATLLNVAGLGFGFKPLLFASIFFLFSFLLVNAFCDKKYYTFIVLGILLILCLFEPAGLQLVPVIAFVLLITNHHTFAGALLTSHLILSVSLYVPIPAYFLSPYINVLLFLAFTFFFSKVRFLASSSFFVYSLCSMVSLFIVFDLPAIENLKIGNVAQKITGKATESSAFFQQDSRFNGIITPKTAYYFEHGTYNNDLIAGDYRQPHPWTWQQVIAVEPIRFAIEKDSQLILNWGAYFNLEAPKPIFSLMEKGRVIPLALNKNGSIFLADTDFLADKLSAYQTHLLKRLTGEDVLFCYLYVLLLVLFSISPWLDCFTFKKKVVEVLFCIVFACILFVESFLRHSGDVRFCGERRFWPHTDLGYGVVRALNDQGICSLFGDVNTWLVVVEEGCNTTHNGEKIIVLEPNASIEVYGQTVISKDFPLGVIGPVIDAREIIMNDEKWNGICVVNDVKIVATGSPSKLNYKEIIKYEK